MIYLGVFIFFITFFRLSLFLSSFYLVFIPAVLGFFYFFKNNRKIIIQRNQSVFCGLFVVLFIYCGLLDAFQLNVSLDSSFLFRMITIILFSFFPAYYLNNCIIKGQKTIFDKIIKISFWVQTAFFILMFLNPTSKIILYNLFGMGDSVNLTNQNLLTRGFGLSAEINFMSPFLMVLMVFLLYKKDFIIKILIFSTQIVNSNMALIAGILGIFVSNSNRTLKFVIVGFFTFVYYFFGIQLIRNFMPRLYDEYIVGGGGRTTDILFTEHVFLLEKLDLFSFMFGFQKNISSSVTQYGRFSDIGWVIMFNYGGVFLIILFILFILCLSLIMFKNKFYAILWFSVGIIFNTKGMIIGMNGYFFLSFLLLLSKRYKN